MKFFKSEIVKEEMKEISDLQIKIYKNYPRFLYMTKEEKMNHIELLEKLLEKQQILYARISLSDDEDAQKMKNNILETAQLLGFSPNVNMNEVFGETSKMLTSMKDQIDRMDFLR